MTTNLFDPALTPSARFTFSPQSPVDRWILLVAAVVFAPADVLNLSQWAKSANMSRSTLCNRCDMVNALPKASLTLGRVLRTLVLTDAVTWHPETVMNTVDIRTLAAIMRAIGVEDYRASGRPSLDAILIAPDWDIPVQVRAALGQWLRRHLPSI